jgi:predicted PurR-regulated permease PerM
VKEATSASSRDLFRRSLKAAAAVALVALAALVLVLEGRVLLILLAGVLFALALRGVSAPIASKLGVPYRAVLLGVVVLLLAAFGLGLFALGAGIAAQAQAFMKAVPAALHSVMDAVRRQPALAPLAQPEGSGAPLPGQAAFAAGAANAVELFGACIVVFFLGVYGAAQPEAYPRVVLLLVPPAHRARARVILRRMATELTRWLGGRAVAMAVVGVLVTAGLLVMKVPLAWALGALAGMLAFIEYLGAYASAAPAMLVAFTRAPIYAVWVGVLFTAVHILEGYVLTPLLVRSTVRFPPAYTLASQVVLGAIFGVAGLTFATPVMIVATILVKYLYVDRMAAAGAEKSDDERESEPPVESHRPGRAHSTARGVAAPRHHG